MFAMMYKDFLILRRYLLLMIPLSLLLVYGSMVKGEPSLWFLPALGLLYTFIFASMSIGFDDKGKFRLFALSSPASAADYVLSKFSLSWVISLFTLLLTFVVGKFFTGVFWEELMLVSMISLALPLFMAIIILPPLLYLGEEKARIVIALVYLLVFIGLSRIGKYALPIFEKVIAMKSYPWGPGLVFLAGIVLIHGMAIVLTTELVKKKEYQWFLWKRINPPMISLLFSSGGIFLFIKLY